jgi:hypothetical protein
VLVNIASTRTLDQSSPRSNAKAESPSPPSTTTARSSSPRDDRRLQRLHRLGSSLAAQTAQSGARTPRSRSMASPTRPRATSSPPLSRASRSRRGLTVPGTPVRVTAAETPVDRRRSRAKMKAFVDAYNQVSTSRGPSSPRSPTPRPRR